MAISPFEFIASNSKDQVSLETIAKLESLIDSILLQKGPYCYHVMVTEEGYIYQIHLPLDCQLNDYEKSYLASVYYKSGWRKVNVFTDFEAGVQAHAVTIIQLFL